MLKSAIVLALLVPALAQGGDGGLQAVKERYLPPAQALYSDTPDGAQARYDAGRDLVEAVVVGPVGTASGAAPTCSPRPRAGRACGDRVTASAASARWPAAGGGCRRRAAPSDPTLARRLAEAAASANGAVGVWVHDLTTGRYAGHEAETRFAAASTVKLGALVADSGLATGRAQPLVVRHPPDRVLVVQPRGQRILAKLGYGAVGDGLRRLGMTASTYPGPYRATTAYRPPGPHTRVTTAHDLGRALHRLHAARTVTAACSACSA